KYNEKTGRKLGRITRMEFMDDEEISTKLFLTAESWLREKGMESVHGPLGFTNIDSQGLLIEGFEYLPSIASVYNKPYYGRHFENNGYLKENDWVEFRLTLAGSIPEKAMRLAEVIKKRFGLEVFHFARTEDLTRMAPDVFSLMNKAFSELPYVAPFSGELSGFYIKKYFRILNPDFVVVIKKDGVILAFILGMPSLSRAMQKANGKLFPFGIRHIMKAIRKPEVIDLMLTGVDPEYQAMGLPAILIAELQQVMIRYGVRQVETTGIFESNQKAIQHWKNYEHVQHKRRRCYIKEL
ncbi:MAG: GNAT family N-acetyltransferase, partial [Bacteroidales bacterium]|nr:GNAT family N-acetyltransferase [Bacteroidales bacterium]